MVADTEDRGELTLARFGRWRVAWLAKSNSTKTLLAYCDLTRRNDLDGRGTLSEEVLGEFTRFLLDVCMDQVTFSLVDPARLTAALGGRGDETGQAARQFRSSSKSSSISR